MDDPPPVRRGPGRPPLNRNKPPGSASSSANQPWRSSQQRTSTYAPQRPTSQQGLTVQELVERGQYVPPHLHPAYKGRGRPPLALGRRQVPAPGQGPVSHPSSKPSNYVSQRARAAAQAAQRAQPSPAAQQQGQHAAQQAQTQHQAQPRPLPMLPPSHPGLGPLQSLMHKEPAWINAGGTNRLLLSLKSGMPSHVRWALSRLVYNSVHLPDHLVLEYFPGLLEILIRLVRQLISAVQGESAEKWDPALLEQKERDFDGMCTSAADETAGEDGDTDDDDDEDDEGVGQGVKSVFVVRGKTNESLVFNPQSLASHQRVLDHAISCMLILRNASLNERNERTILHYSRSVNTLIADILALPTSLKSYSGPEEWAELPGLQELRIYALDTLELTRTKLHLRSRAVLDFDVNGIPKAIPDLKLPETIPAVATNAEQNGTEKSSNVITKNTRISHQILSMLVWLLHTSDDRTMIIGCLRCLGALAAEEKNETAFVETDVMLSAGKMTSSPGIVRKCLSLLPLTQDGALLEAALDCLYQVINVGDNALRLGNVEAAEHNIAAAPSNGERSGLPNTLGDARSVVQYLVRDLIYGRVIWDRSHQLAIHPALHGHVPSAVNGRRREREELWRKRKRADGQDEKEVAKQRRLNKEEWMKMKDVAEPGRLAAWMRMIYEPKEEGEVTQMEFWATYSTQFGPYSQLGGPPLLPAAEVIRSVSNIFPGALAMVLPNQRFIVRGVQPRDRGHLRRFECRWKGCTQPETDTYEAVQTHIHDHAKQSDDGHCAWASCTYVVPAAVGASGRGKHLDLHALTHLPEKEEISVRREAELQEKQRYGDLVWKATLKSKPLTKSTMANGARYINGPTALTPFSSVGADWHKIETERQDAKRRKAYNLPTRGTVDLPDILGFSVTRTPMDPQTQRPTGIASSASLVLRTLSRVSASILIKAGDRRQRVREAARKMSGDGDHLSANSERFGLPLPPVKAVETADVAQADAAGGGGSAAADLLLGGADEQATRQAAERIMDSLFDVEDELIQVASENDILCPTLSEILFDLRPEQGQSIVIKKDVEGEGDESQKSGDGSEMEEEEEEEEEDDDDEEEEEDEEEEMDAEGEEDEEEDLTMANE